MFSLAHLTFAYVFGRFIDKNDRWHLDRPMWLCLLVGGDLPDIDSHIADIFNLGHSFHGGVTHTGVGSIILGLILGLIFWLIESAWIKKRALQGNGDKKAWDTRRLLIFVVIAILGNFIHLAVDIFNTSNEYARIHHLYLWPISDYSFHLDLMLAGMPDTINEAWAFRPIVRFVMIIVNVLLISWLWFTHFKSEKHLWDLIYSDTTNISDGKEPPPSPSKVQKFLDDNKKALNLFLLIVFTFAFFYRIFEHLNYIQTLMC